ncbi:MAG: DsbC family protein [Desulfuromonadaceae bacterium]|nr:DsbC family protein [Desulfuromonadaceae bacterium]
MLKEICCAVAVMIIVVSSSYAMAKDGCGGDCASCHTLSTQEASGLLKKIGGTVTSVRYSPARGLFELLVEREGQKGIIFMDYGKKHIIQGAVFDLEKLEQVIAHKNELPQAKQITSVDVKTIPTANAVILGNPNGSKKLYVFTDPDCPYCRKGHVELKKLVRIDKDVAIYIMLFPLPMHPGAYEKARTIIETKNHDFLDRAFDGKEIPKPTNENSKTAIDEIVKFANKHGISGTPTMILPDGAIQVGMRDADSLKKLLEGK